ncbi:MAG: hypothetical protein HGB22_10195 [Chlorobiaceae bacterium]|nr:hypothetical protein [Chlorobiaceae bacterium]
MKKLVTYAAFFAALSYASPAFGELKIGGDASVRARSETYDVAHSKSDELYWQYRVRLNAAADLGDGYIFKAQITNEAPNVKDGSVALGGGGGWQRVGYGNTELYTLGVSQAYFGRFYGDSHYLIGRLPLNSTNNPILDLTLYPKNPLDIPTTTYNNDRLYGANYGTKIGKGDLNLVVGVFDNVSANDASGSGNGILNDGYALLLSYKTTIGNVTIEPEVLTAITKFDSITQQTFSTTSSSYGKPWHQGIRPVTFGGNVSVPAGDLKLGFSGLYTIGNGTTPSSTAIYGANANANVDYTGYLLRVKAEYGPFLAWYDHSVTTDKSTSTTQKYTNNFVWAQYQFKVYSSAKGTLTVQPTIRYLTTRDDVTPANDSNRLRSELWATVTF